MSINMTSPEIRQRNDKASIEMIMTSSRSAITTNPMEIRGASVCVTSNKGVAL